MSDTSTKGPLAMTTDRDDIASLLAKVKAATGPDRDLDRSIWRHFNPLPTGRASDVVLPPGFGKGALNDALDPTPVLTASIDAALALVERLYPGEGIVLKTHGINRAGIGQSGKHPATGATAPIAILAALLTFPPDHGGGDGWQSIETAPKDGSLFLAYSSRNGSCDLLRWQRRRERYQPTFVSALGYGGIPIAFVTHWHPLPSLPTQESEDGR